MNYNSFFGFSESPFLEAPDLKFLFLGKQHEVILAALNDFVQARQGVAVLCGEEGVGKTMLALALLPRLAPSFHPVVLGRPEAEPLAISLLIGQTLGLDLRERNIVNLTRLEEAVRAAAQKGDYFLILLDDAHLLTDQHLEEVYILSQLEDQGRQLMPLILMGRKGLRHKVASKTNQRLFALIQQNLELTGLTFDETTRYIDHRLQQVGSSYQACFADACSGQIFARTGGIPRRINQVCDQALTRAWKENRSRVTRDLLGGEEPTAAYKPLAPPPRRGFGRIAALVGAAALLVGVLAYLSSSHYFSPGRRPPPPAAEAPVLPSQPPAPQAKPPLQEEARGGPPGFPSASPQPRKTVPEGEAAGPEPTPLAEPGRRAVEPQAPEADIHRVTSADRGLLKIVAAHYAADQETGYDAVILANPHIEHEDMIYAGWILVMPQVDKVSKIITLPNKQYYAVFKHASTSSQAEKAAARLRELQLRFTVRETLLHGDYKMYRIYLGGYESREELQRAKELAEKD